MFKPKTEFVYASRHMPQVGVASDDVRRGSVAVVHRPHSRLYATRALRRLLDSDCAAPQAGVAPRRHCWATAAMTLC